MHTMFLHSGASLHGHEYSNRASVPQAHHPHKNLRSPLLRSAFATPKSRLATVIDEPTRPPAFNRRPVSDYIPRTPEPVVRFMEPEPESEPEREVVAPQKKLQYHLQRPQPLSPKALQQQRQDTQTPPQTRRALTNEEPISESDLSDATQSTETSRLNTGRRKRRAPRKSTNYSLGYPAPRILGKKKVVQKVLPRLMLQLQQVLDNGRSMPVLEVFPATRISGPVIAPRMAKRFPGIFGVKQQLCYDDLVLVRRDDYGVNKSDGPESGGDEDSSLEDRKLLAVYSPLKNSDAVEIVMDDGSVWVATVLRNGSFDFVHVDPMGNATTARWARRSAPSTSPTEPFVPGATPPVQEPRFTFSIINPLSRRHPVMATLTKSSLSVQDTYASVSSSHSRYPPSRPLGRSLSTTSPTPSRKCSTGSQSNHSSDCEGDSAVSIPPEPETERTVHTVDEATKMLIGVTSLWVALASGWSANYTPYVSRSATTTPETAAPSTAAPLAKSTRRNTWSRSTLASTVVNLSDSEASAAPTTVFSKRYTLPSPGQGGALLEKTRSISPGPPTGASVQVATPQAPIRMQSTPSPAPTLPAISSGSFRFLPRRATSTGAAFMQRRLEKQAPAPAVIPAPSPSPQGLAGPDAGYWTSATVGQGQIQGFGQSQSQVHRRTQSATYVWNPISRPASEPPAFDIDEDDDGGSPRFFDTRDAPRDGGARLSPPLTLGEADTMEEGKRGVRARLTRWFHKIGGR
jgi:hypothetical protein